MNYFAQAYSDDEDSDNDEPSQSSGELSLGGFCVMSLALAEWEVKFVRMLQNL